MKSRSVVVTRGLSAGFLAIATLLARQRHITRRLNTENATMRSELTARDEELVYGTTVQIPGALEALHNRDLDAAPPPFRPEIAESERGRNLKKLTDLIIASDEKYLQHVDQAVKTVLRTVMRRVQSLSAEQQVAISIMEDKHDDPDVLEGLLRMDHMNAQLGRRAQAIAVLCGGWPGQQRTASSLTDVVRGATSRIRDFNRVNTPTHTEIAIVPRAVEPVVLAVSELLDNAARHSQPGASIEVTFRREADGAAIVIDDAGVGMTVEALAKATEMLSGPESMDIHLLGDPPQVGFAVIGVLVARYGFTASVEAISHDQEGHGGTRATVFLPNALLTSVDESVTEQRVAGSETAGSDPALAWTDSADDEAEYQTTPGGLPIRPPKTPASAATASPAVRPAAAANAGQEHSTGQAGALGAWQRGTRRHDDKGSRQT